MAHDDKINMPSAQAGLTRYFEESHSKVRFKPQHIIILAVIIILIEVFLHARAASWLGIG
jgi:preprotein translocase subunit Sec61beta